METQNLGSMRIQNKLLRDLGWDITKNSGYTGVLKPKIAFDEILGELPKDYTKGRLREIIQGKDLMKVIAEATAFSEFERKVLGHLTSICAETNHKLTIWRELDFVGNELEGGVITVMRAPGKMYTAGEHVGYRMKEGLIKVNGKARSIGPTLGGIIWANKVDKLIGPNKAEIIIGDKDIQSFYHQEKYGRGKILDDLLQKMDYYDWSRVADITIDEIEKENKLKYFKDIIEDSGIKLDGPILEFDVGVASIGHLYRDVIAIERAPKNVKYLRKQGIRAVIGTIQDLTIEDDSFDYVVAFDPLMEKVQWIDKKLYKFMPDTNYKEKMVEKAIAIARKNVLIASVELAINPVYEGRIKIIRRAKEPYYVLYNATGFS